MKNVQEAVEGCLSVEIEQPEHFEVLEVTD
jgi:hypothetical protein